MGGQVGIGGGVPNGGIDAVQDAGEDIAATGDEIFETAAGFRSLNFRRVGWADGGDGVASCQCALHEAEGAVGIEGGGGFEVAVETEIGHGLAREAALEGQIVDGEHGFDVHEGGMSADSFAQENGQQAGGPIVTVDDGRGEQSFGGCQGAAGQGSEAEVIVGKVEDAFGIHAGTLVERGDVEEEVVDALDFGFVDVGKVVMGAEGDVQGAVGVLRGKGADLRVVGEKDGDFVAGSGEGDRKALQDFA